MINYFILHIELYSISFAIVFFTLESTCNWRPNCVKWDCLLFFCTTPGHKGLDVNNANVMHFEAFIIW